MVEKLFRTLSFLLSALCGELQSSILWDMMLDVLGKHDAPIFGVTE
jgi:hypothetical protein